MFLKVLDFHVYLINLINKIRQLFCQCPPVFVESPCELKLFYVHIVANVLTAAHSLSISRLEVESFSLFASRMSSGTLKHFISASFSLMIQNASLAIMDVDLCISHLGFVVLDLHGLLELVHGPLERGLLLAQLLDLLDGVNQALQHQMGGDLS